METCQQLRTFCERNAPCAGYIQKLKSCTDLNAENDEICVNIAKRLFHHFKGHCDCCLDSSVRCISLRNHSNAVSICPRINVTQMTYNERKPPLGETERVLTPHSVPFFPITQTNKVHKGDLEEQKTRYTRSPVAGQIKKWKNELFEELRNGRTLRAISCNEALFEICLKHLSCRELWNIFRNACEVDSANKCLMTNRDDCWQAFEGLSWTGLGNCSCHDRNSDCHWIRLQTRYNKCVYEISLSGDMPSLFSFLPREHLLFKSQAIPEQYRISSTYYNLQTSNDSQQSFITENRRSEANAISNEELQDFEKLTAKAAIEKGMSANTGIRKQLWEQFSGEVQMKKEDVSQTTTADLQSTPTPTVLQLVAQLPRPEPKDAYTQTEDSWINTITAKDELKGADKSKQYKTASKIIEKTEQKKLQPATTSATAEKEAVWKSRHFNKHSMSKPISVNRTSLLVATVPAPQFVISTPYGPPVTPKSFVELVPKNSSTSTCVAPRNRCERFENCKLHLKEVQNHCGDNCSRQQCAAALQRFTRYIARASVESLMFCYCDKQDTECLNYQQLLYPRCLYYNNGTVSLTCTEAVEKCRLDRHCQHYSSAFFYYCPVQGDHCAISEMDHCRHAIIAVRGTYLDYPCYCPQNDAQCKRYQAGMLPNNPCIEKSIIEYSSLMSDVLPSRDEQPTSRVTNIHTDGNRNAKSFSDKNILGGVTPLKKKPVTSRLDELNKSKTREANRKEMSSQQNSSETIGKKQTLVKQRKTEEEKLGNTYNMDVGNAEVNAWLGKKTKTGSLNETNYGLDKSKNEELSSGRVKVDKDDDWKSRTMTVLEREAPHFQPQLSKKHDMQEKDRKGSRTETSADVRIVYAYETSSKQSPTAKVLIPKLSISKPAAKIRPTKNEERSIDKQNENRHFPSTSKVAQQQKPSKISSTRVADVTYSDAPIKDNVRMVDHSVDRLNVKKSSTEKQSGGTYTTAQPKSTQSPQEHIGQATSTPLKNYATELPLASGGCATKDVYGNDVIHRKGSIFRRYHDWAGRCSSWCTCDDNEKMTCSKLPCLAERDCKAPLTKIEYGERLYLKDRGACTCMNGLFICEQPNNFPKLNLGLYLLVGYSIEEVTMLKKSVPKNILERAGFVSGNDYIVHDIGSRLQLALERILPPNTQCRITLLKEYEEESNVIYQLEWFGVNRFINESGKRWHTGQAEKVCSPYVTRLANGIMRNEAVRYQLVLSTVKQIRVYDSLNGLPDHATLCRMPPALVFITFILLRFFVT